MITNHPSVLVQCIHLLRGEIKSYPKLSLEKSNRIKINLSLYLLLINQLINMTYFICQTKIFYMHKITVGRTTELPYCSFISGTATVNISNYILKNVPIIITSLDKFSYIWHVTNSNCFKKLLIVTFF